MWPGLGVSWRFLTKTACSACEIGHIQMERTEGSATLLGVTTLRARSRRRRTTSMASPPVDSQRTILSHPPARARAETRHGDYYVVSCTATPQAS